jgi:diketogulonate reductase-like aldo/keto reductase
MLAIWKAGKARAVGVSNYNTSHLQEIEDANLLMPAVNQVHFNPHLNVIQRDVKLFCESRQIVLNGYSPLGAPDAHSFPSSLGMESSLLDEPSVRAIAKKHGRSPAEIIIAWQVSQGVWVNPRTSNPEHMKENLLAVSQPPLLSVADVDTLSSLPQDNCQDNPLWYECEGTHGNNGVLV